MSRVAYDEDGIDGPWERAMAREMRADATKRAVYVCRGLSSEVPCTARGVEVEREVPAMWTFAEVLCPCGAPMVKVREVRP